jgi:hypothetical protein
MALHLFPLVAFVAAGARWVAADGAKRWRLAVLAAACVVLAGGVRLARGVQVPDDERWYVRFPHAARNDSGLAELPEERRMDWHYFYTRETPAEIERERAKLTTPRPWPSLYLPFVAPAPDTLARMASEPFTRHLRTLAIWSYIYE